MPKAAPKHRPALPRAKRHCPPEQSRQARRALATNSAAWRQIRAGVLAVEPLCRECGKKRIIRPANQVDHIDGNDSNNEFENLQPLCGPCHSRKTAKENGGFGNQRVRA